MDIFIAQFFLGILLFVIINWIGKHSYSIGYMGVSIFAKSEDAPALNFLIRVLTPIVYLIIVSSILYFIGLDSFVLNIYMVNIYYIIFRLVFNLITNRGKLLNWYGQFLYWISIILLSYLFYEKIIKNKENILPDFTTIANELWIIILVFLFQLSNKMSFSQNGVIRRKEKYLLSRYKYFNRLYGNIIRDITKNEVLESVVFAILIYEDFNRPKVIRIVENLKHIISSRNHTLGVMQVTTDKLISDEESVIHGTNKIVSCYRIYISKNTVEGEKISEWDVINHIISDYNVGTDYLYEVINLSYEIKDLFYKNTKDNIGQDLIS